MQSAHLAAAVAANRHANLPSPQGAQTLDVTPTNSREATPTDAWGACNSLFSTPLGSRAGSAQPPDASPPHPAGLAANDSFSLLDNASGWSSNGSVYATPSPSPSSTDGALGRRGYFASPQYRLRSPDILGVQDFDDADDDADDDATVVGSAVGEFVPSDADAVTDVGDEVDQEHAAHHNDDATVEAGLLRPQRRAVASASRSCGATRLVGLGYGMATGVTLGFVLGGAWHLYKAGGPPGAVAGSWSRTPTGAVAAANAGARNLLAKAPSADQLAQLWDEAQGAATRAATVAARDLGRAPALAADVAACLRARLPETPSLLAQGAASLTDGLHNALERLADAAARDVRPA